MNARDEFLRLVSVSFPEIPESIRQSLGVYYEEVTRENKVQNLTRLISPRDFLEGHLMDGVELLRSGLLEYPALDLGSGAGVPGLLAAILRPEPWILAESEGRKAEFLRKCLQRLRMGHVQIFSGRGEAALELNEVGSVVARAVGPVSRVYGWIRRCSTWNTLVLMKGPRWEEEWAEFQRDKKLSRGVELAGSYRYQVGAENKDRIIVKLARK